MTGSIRKEALSPDDNRPSRQQLGPKIDSQLVDD
jgi:hypothetical protein